MDPITVLPNTEITDAGPFCRAYLAEGQATFHDAAEWTKCRPYGYNDDKENPLVLFTEGRGTCTTKHGAIASLAGELGLDVVKSLGIYPMDGVLVTGIQSLLDECGMDFVPATHCFLRSGPYRVDLTEGNCNGKNHTIDSYLHIRDISPFATAEEEKAIYSDFLRGYLCSRGETEICEVLDRCIDRMKANQACALQAMPAATASE